MGLKEIFGRNININNEIRDKYRELQQGFVFKGNDKKDREYKYIFMMCLALGYKTGKRTPVTNTNGLLNVSSFEEDDLWTMAAIALEETDDIQVMKNGPEIKKIATEYAHTGLSILEDLIFENGPKTFELVIEGKARDELKALKSVE